MDEDARGNIKLLIKIILYLLLALAFFSYNSLKNDNSYINEILLVFVFGIFALIFLFLGSINNSVNLFRYFGYGFTGSSIAIFLFFLIDNLCVSYFKTRFIYSWYKLPLLLNSKTINCALIIFFVVASSLFVYEIWKILKNKNLLI